ncbi:MAG: hypothetical protein ACR2PH_16130, partial [Desulfobulbia bacterium]
MVKSIISPSWPTAVKTDMNRNDIHKIICFIINSFKVLKIPSVLHPMVGVYAGMAGRGFCLLSA